MPMSFTDVSFLSQQLLRKVSIEMNLHLIVWLCKLAEQFGIKPNHS